MRELLMVANAAGFCNLRALICRLSYRVARNHTSEEVRTIRIFGTMLAIALMALLAFGPWFRVQPRDYSRADLMAAKQYLDGLNPDRLVPLFPDNQPVSRLATGEPLGDQAINDLKLARPSLFRRAWGLADIEIVVISNFLHMTAAERQEALAGYSLRNNTRAMLLNAQPKDNGCIVYRYILDGWSEGGFLLVDPAAASMTAADVSSCVIAGFDHLLGVPTEDARFDFRTFPKPNVSMVLFDYLRHCSEIGETNVSPKQTSRSGVTNFPSIQCISRGIEEAINRSPAKGS
jgi:hypothetical protein